MLDKRLSFDRLNFVLQIHRRLICYFLEPFELVSPIFMITASTGDIKYKDSRPSSIHLRGLRRIPRAARFSSRARRIAKTPIPFEPVIEVLLPEHRRSSLWAKSNHADHPQLEVRTVQQI